MLLAVEAYRVSEQFPRHERFGLDQQLRRAAVSVPSNIAEGHSRRTRQVYINHLNIALGSLAEFETQLTLGRASRIRARAGRDWPSWRGMLHERRVNSCMALVHALEKSPHATA